MALTEQQQRQRQAALVSASEQPLGFWDTVASDLTWFENQITPPVYSPVTSDGSVGAPSQVSAAITNLEADASGILQSIEQPLASVGNFALTALALVAAIVIVPKLLRN